MSERYKTNISNSTIGAVALGPNANATGTVTTQGISQQDYEKTLIDAQKALVEDQVQLDNLADGLYEALNQLLRIARQIQVDQKSFLEVQTMMKGTIDDVWASQISPRLKNQGLPTGLSFAKVLLTSPVTAELVKNWLET